MSAIGEYPPVTSKTGLSRPAGLDPADDAEFMALTATTFEATRAERYVYGLVDRGWISERRADKAVETLRGLLRQLPGLPIPNIAPGPDDLIGFSWRTRDHHLSLELHADGHFEAFHEDLASRALWSDENGCVPVGLLDRLTNVI